MINRHWADTLPQDIYKDKKTMDFLVRLNGKKHIVSEQTATVKRQGENE